jgi:hypothetical protein
MWTAIEKEAAIDTAVGPAIRTLARRVFVKIKASFTTPTVEEEDGSLGPLTIVKCTYKQVFRT